MSVIGVHSIKDDFKYSYLEKPYFILFCISALRLLLRRNIVLEAINDSKKTFFLILLHNHHFTQFGKLGVLKRMSKTSAVECYYLRKLQAISLQLYQE